ncbi:MAG TPA: hypothetical protein VH601_06555 [Bryobacteraceae bacterium]
MYLGKTALEESYAGLGTVTIAADGHSGTFVLNDPAASGRFDCGTVRQSNKLSAPGAAVRNFVAGRESSNIEKSEPPRVSRDKYVDELLDAAHWTRVSGQPLSA